MNLATPPIELSSNGKTKNVSKSGRRYISASLIRTKPSIDEPSNIILLFNASSILLAGISTALISPNISVNCILIYEMLFSLIIVLISSLVIVISSLEKTCSKSITIAYIMSIIFYVNFALHTLKKRS